MFFSSSSCVVVLLLDSILAQEIPLSRYGMLMAHDAASGYLRDGGEIMKWTKTQDGNVTNQLNCGARAFDWRPMADDDKVIAHHGDVKIRDAELQDVLLEVRAWLAEFTEEFVLFYIWDCTGNNCSTMANEILHDAGVFVYDGCPGTLTLNHVKQLARLDSGGYFMVVTECIDQNYNASLACSGFDDEHRPYSCSSSSFDQSEYPFDALFSSLDSVSSSYNDAVSTSFKTEDTKSSSRLFEMQALWQETADSVILGTLQKSSLLKDEYNSGLNARVLAALQEDRWSSVNLLEVNNVCDHGPALYQALMDYNNQKKSTDFKF